MENRAAHLPHYFCLTCQAMDDLQAIASVQGAVQH